MPGAMPGADASKSLPLILARELASNLATPMFLLDARGIVVYFNDAAELLIGKTFAEMGEITGNDFGELLQVRFLDDRPMGVRESPVGIAFFERRPAHRRVRATAFDGQIREVNSTAFPLFGAQEQLFGVVNVFWPMSELNGEM